SFEVAILDQSVVEDQAEKSVMEKVEAVCDVVASNPTLDGLVEEAWISGIESETGVRGSYAVVGALITIITRKTV
ncbi:MAG: hypothetical protein DRO52_05145, partial [Candidatus Hecatellales archaeon]